MLLEPDRRALTLSREDRMGDDDELKPGVDRPTRWQYVIGAAAIIVASMLAYWWLGHHR
jgi:hypothetical protein